MATQLAHHDEPATLGQAISQLNGQLTRQADQFKAVLPSNIRPEQFQRVIITAVTSDPDLLRCDRRSLVNCCMKAAQDGLLPDKREAALVVYNTRKQIDGQWQSVKEVQYMPMVYGLRKKILQSAKVKDIFTSVVYRREVESGNFYYEEGTARTLRHKPMLDLTDEESTDDQIVAGYSVATFDDGSQSYEVMRRSEINKVRQASQTGAVGRTTRDGKPIAPKGPWVDWFAEMAKKTVMRRHSKVLPMSSDLIDIEAYDEEMAARSSTTVLSVEPDRPTALPARETQLRDAAEAGADDETGELPASDPEAARRAAEDEETARQLDAQQQHGDDEDDAEDEEQPEQGQAPEPEQSSQKAAPADDDADMLATFIAKIQAAGDKAALAAVEREFVKVSVAFSDKQVGRVEAALTDARRRLAKDS